jgi:hypothetical protein
MPVRKVMSSVQRQGGITIIRIGKDVPAGGCINGIAGSTSSGAGRTMPQSSGDAAERGAPSRCIGMMGCFAPDARAAAEVGAPKSTRNDGAFAWAHLTSVEKRLH